MIDTLTSLRFLFALMVFGAHCYVIDDFFAGHFFKEGFVGVSFFFVLLTYQKWQAGSGSPFAWYVAVPVLFGITVLLSLFSYYRFEKPMNRFVKSILNK